MDAFAKYTTKETYAKIVDYASVSQMWAHSIATYPNNIALVDNGENISYLLLEEQVAKMRTVLVEKGIKKGDYVGVYIPNSANFAKAFLAITTLGACAVLMPPHLDAVTVFGCSLKFGLKALVCAESLKENTKFLQEKRPDFTIIGEDESREEKTDLVLVEGEAPCTVIFTGGTTGKSKGALLNNKAVLKGTKNGCYGTKDVFEQKYLLVLPLTHVFGLIRNLLTSLYTGSTLFICRNNKDMFRDVATFNPTIMVMVPALAEMCLNLSKQFKRNMLGTSLKNIICGAATVPPYLVTEYEKFGIDLLPGYGLTESANLVSGNAEPKRKVGSVGLMYDGMDYKIVDGELWLKGDNMLTCYVGEPEENAIAFEDGYFKTGDLVRIDEEGYLYIVGRKKEIIVLPTGENISPAEIEAEFAKIDALQDCLVYESTVDGKSVLALEVYPRATILATIDVEDKDAYLKEQINLVNKTLPSFKRISKIVIRTTDFVRSPSMKIVRSENGKN